MHFHDRNLEERPYALEVPSNASGTEDSVEAEEKISHPKTNLFKNWPLMSAIVVYCVFSLQEIAYAEVSYCPFSCF